MEEQKKPEPSIKYDPNKNYGWKKEDIFYLSGNEFGAIYQALKALEPLGQHILIANKVTTDILVRNVENGIIQEQKLPEPEVPKKLEPQKSKKGK